MGLEWIERREVENQQTEGDWRVTLEGCREGGHDYERDRREVDSNQNSNG